MMGVTRNRGFDRGFHMRVMTGCALAALTLSAAILPALAASDTGTATVTILRPITVTKNTDLRFGTVVEPSSGSATVRIDATGARTTTLDVGGAAFGVSDFTVAGEGGQAVAVSVPATFPINKGPDSLTVTTTAAGDTLNTGAQTLSGSLGSPGVLDVRVGGQITVQSTTNSGTYSGVFTVTASYN
jgi:hypothetical protein